MYLHRYSCDTSVFRMQSNTLGLLHPLIPLAWFPSVFESVTLDFGLVHVSQKGKLWHMQQAAAWAQT